MPFSDSTPVLRLLPGEQFQVVQPFWFTLGQPVAGVPAGARITIPDGFPTDLASVPRLFWGLLPPNGNYAPAAIIHDRLYRAPGHEVEGRTYTRAQADAILLEAMAELGTVGWLVRKVVYWAVRLGGGACWNDELNNVSC